MVYEDESRDEEHIMISSSAQLLKCIRKLENFSSSGNARGKNS
jgi:hypothetical protein